ncbi:DUF6475 domain-containing protein [Achromobacter deleyi]|uniref:DUF6475 domain-containing protein n=1 Tax=Achromobacter deleyi TaxID=1353891 RepID=UPI001E481B4C|nr:DUF6475 domain-containing protein [Achromobacter deleyi]
MIDADKPALFELVGNVYSFYAREASVFVFNVWWEAVKAYDLDAVSQAFSRHCANPDSGQFLPKPADVVKMLHGSTQDAALQAWAKVDRAVRGVGTWASVAFDDPLIHRVLHDMGGWSPLGRKEEREWPFLASEFVNRYRGYRGRSERPEYPPILLGDADAHNGRIGAEAGTPVLIGDAGRAALVVAGGACRPLVEFHRPEVLSLSAQSQQALLASAGIDEDMVALS